MLDLSPADDEAACTVGAVSISLGDSSVMPFDSSKDSGGRKGVDC